MTAEQVCRTYWKRLSKVSRAKAIATGISRRRGLTTPRARLREGWPKKVKVLT